MYCVVAAHWVVMDIAVARGVVGRSWIRWLVAVVQHAARLSEGRLSEPET